MPSSPFQQQLFSINERATTRNQLQLPITHRRHSLQIELQTYGSEHFDATIENEPLSFRTFNCSENLDEIRHKYMDYKKKLLQKQGGTLRRVSSENELLLMSQTNKNYEQRPSPIRRSFSLLF